MQHALDPAAGHHQPTPPLETPRHSVCESYARQLIPHPGLQHPESLPLWVTVESSDKTQSIREGNGKSLQYSCLENPMNSMKRQNDRTLTDELPRSVGAQYTTGDQWRNDSRKNEEMEPKQKQCPAVDVTGVQSKVQCGKEKYCIGTWNVTFMNKGKLEVVKQEMASVNINILGISELIWTGMGEFNSDDHYIYYCGQEYLRRNGVVLIVNRRV